MKKVSLIVTVLNEESTILGLLESIAKLTVKPDETIIVDGGSTDTTISIVEKFIKQSKYSNNIKILQKDGNRSVGRNFAISSAKNNWIAITDAGCILEEKWLENLLKTQERTKAEVVAGYYEAVTKTAFEEAVVPYALVMPDRINPETFLPATRSMLLNKSVWKKLGGFDEKLDDNEDYAFAKKIEQAAIKRAFARDAIVYWLPRKNLFSFVKMIFRFARGDIYAGIIRPKVLLIFARYFLALLFFVWVFFVDKSLPIFGLFFIVVIFYFMWSIIKNYRYTPNSWFLLPILQISSDLAVICGSISGFMKRLF